MPSRTSYTIVLTAIPSDSAGPITRLPHPHNQSLRRPTLSQQDSSTMSSIPSVPLGGTASSLSISRASVGLMGLTWVDKAAFTPDEQAFKVIKEYIDSTENPLLNTGAFYGPQPEDPMANLKLLNRYFQKYPEDTQKCILCVKGGFPLDGEKGMGTVGMAAFQSPNVTIEALRHELQLVRKTLGSDEGGKEIDLWEPARLPSKYVPLEKLVQMYTQAREEGLFKHLSLSEVKGETLEKVIQLTNGGVASVEVEYSVFCREVEEMGVLDVCEKYSEFFGLGLHLPAGSLQRFTVY